MKKVKLPSVAGVFYPNEKGKLLELMFGWKKSQYVDKGFKTRAVIVPHAAYIYSGAVANKGMSLLDPEVKKVFIFAPAHREAFFGMATSSCDIFQTPLGYVERDMETVSELMKNFKLQEKDSAFELEHAIEVQLPFLQKMFEDIQIIPILVSKCGYEPILNIIDRYYDDKEYGFVISSDLCHYLPLEEAKKVDNLTARMIESGNLEGFTYEMACGAAGIAALTTFANKRDFSLIRVDMATSADAKIDEPAEKVVGYGSWALYENKSGEFIKEYYADFVLDLVKKAVEAEEKEMTVEFPPVFNSLGASFVTLEKNGALRGCIGSIIAHRELILDLVGNARNAAFKDPRFSPVTKEEFDELEFKVSLLSPPVKIAFEDEEDLLRRIVQGKDGIIIKDLGRQAVYLPSVWEQINDKRQFLNSLKIKAGFAPEHWSESFEAYRFKTVYIK